ncbi:MAG: RIP metalloprotease RseP [Gemmatimonadota bacterium]|jgi:regulator of sigma E protease|nr:MAG: RIP metalloprotease RseP [Gemmatimonadota bacterium]
MILTILATVVVLGVLIFVHELGHFLAAKAVDIEVQRFSLGLGPKMVGFRKGETEYVVSWFPLGGYVKMAGMAEEEGIGVLEGGASGERTPSPRDFDAKSLPARTLVISAGVLMNFLFALVAFIVVARAQGVQLAMISTVQEDSPAAEAGFQPGDRILSIQGQRVRSFEELRLLVQQSPETAIRVGVEREGERLSLEVVPRPVRIWSDVIRDSVDVGQIGVTSDPDGGYRTLGWREAIPEGSFRTWYWVRTTLEFIGQLVSGGSSAKEVGGPILIGQLSGQAARAGIWSLLAFMAVISVNLAILNLLPVPVLDGGHLTFLAFEAVRGRALSVEQRIRLTQVGMVLIVGLMVWVITNDVLRLL